MVVPDFELICEIMLVAEGFQEARVLARKFITLYTLCKELLSKQDHYDWGLRAIKSVLVVAGSLKVSTLILLINSIIRCIMFTERRSRQTRRRSSYESVERF